MATEDKMKPKMAEKKTILLKSPNEEKKLQSYRKK